jgi:hypothetical protein
MPEVLLAALQTLQLMQVLVGLVRLLSSWG